MSKTTHKKPPIKADLVAQNFWQSRWLSLMNLALSCYNVGVIWETQLSYRLWPFVGQPEFEHYHDAWWSGTPGKAFGLQGIQPLFIPSSVLTFLGALIQLRWRKPSVPRIAVQLNLISQVLVWILTAAFWGRWQAELKEVRLADGSLNSLYWKLLRTHWLRVALITASAIAQFWMTFTAE